MICTNGHAGNSFFPALARTQYPLVACAMAGQTLPPAVLDVDQLRRRRRQATQFPTGLYPLVIDGRQSHHYRRHPRILVAARNADHLLLLLRALPRQRTCPQILRRPHRN
ncbi:hypothetical protein ACU4GD_05555 [Cupriavidus basilensis]